MHRVEAGGGGQSKVVQLFLRVQFAPDQLRLARRLCRRELEKVEASFVEDTKRRMRIQRYPATAIESFAQPCDVTKDKLNDVRRGDLLLFFLLLIGRQFLKILLFFSFLLPLAG